jgi:hypothetical protein
MAPVASMLCLKVAVIGPCLGPKHRETPARPRHRCSVFPWIFLTRHCLDPWVWRVNGLLEGVTGSGVTSTPCPHCRSMKLVYHEAGVFEGIPIYRFVAPKTLFANGTVYPPNEGFCPCQESGIQNVSTCRHGTCLSPGRDRGQGWRAGHPCLLSLWSLHSC